MTGRRWLLWGTALAGMAAITPAQAQESDEDYRRIVTIMRACATIAEIPARVACYDNNIGPRETDAGGVSPVQPARRVDATPAATGFGADLLASEREVRRTSQAQQAEVRVTGAREEQPGIYILTLTDGAEWRFTDSATFSYEVPRAGDTVKLERGALGSVLMHFDGQRGIRVQRIR